MRRRGAMGTWMAAGVVAACALLPASASALTIGAPDLSGAPTGTIPCASAACTVTGKEPGAGHLFRAPADGRITEVRFRSQVGHESAGLRILNDIGGEEFQFESFFPFGKIPFALDGLHVIPTDIPVVETEILSLELSSGGQLVDYYSLFGATTATFDPAKNQGESAPPSKNPSQSSNEVIPAVQFEFEMVRPPLPEEEGNPPPPSADVAVKKSFSGEYGFAQIGGEAPFYVQVENRGPDTARGVVLKDSFGRGLSFKRAVVLKGSAGKTSCGGGGGRKGGTVTCTIGALPKGAKVGIDFYFQARGKSSKGAGKGVKRKEKNVAVVTSAGPPDPNKKNNRAVAVARIESGGATCPLRSKVGTPGNDRLGGTSRRETILGLQGNDRIKAKRGRDCLFGGDGRDVLIGGPDPDYIEGGAGNDLVLAADGSVDRIRCEGGKRDRVVADRRDRVARDCERVRRR